MASTPLAILALRPDEGRIALSLPLDRWSRRQAMAAAHRLIDRAYVTLARADEGTGAERLIVELRARAATGDVEQLRALAADLERELRRLAPRDGAAVPLRRRDIGPDVLVTNDAGDWALLSPAELERLASGRVTPGEALHAALSERRLLPGALDDRELARARAARQPALNRGPHLHVVVVTLRCDHSCRYCHASRVPVTRSGYDMDEATAERVVETIMGSPNPAVTIEFQGGEPLANFGIVRHVIETAERLNAVAGKRLGFALVSNMSMMDDAKLDYLVAHRVEICTSLDGPRDLHNANRRVATGDSWRRAVEWIGRINQRYREMGLDTNLYRVEAILTATRASLDRPEEIVDAYLDAGCRSVFLRSLNPFGFASATGDRIGYPIEDWLRFYERALDYILALNRRGVDILERNAAIFLTKILAAVDPNFLDVRSPCGAAIGQLAYDHDGSVYTCDEGRMVAAMGDDIFRMGHVAEHPYPELMSADVVRAMVAASTLDGQPGCVDCAYKPFCGVCPVHNYTEMGSLHGRRFESVWCRKHMGVLDILFERLRRARDDRQLMDVLTRWTTVRPRDHFFQGGAAPA